MAVRFCPAKLTQDGNNGRLKRAGVYEVVVFEKRKVQLIRCLFQCLEG